VSEVWPNYRMFDYEKDLARREIDALVGRDVLSAENGQEDARALTRLQERATYLHAITQDGRAARTSQAEAESLHQQFRGGRSNRQATRFLVHGLHEYKGRFNPQLARALVNVADPHATSLLDPFCGSGTTLVEATRLGLDVAGIDQNPLAAWLSDVKTRVLAQGGEGGFLASYRALAGVVIAALIGAESVTSHPTPPGLSPEDEKYLRSWFPGQVLAGMWAALDVCAAHEDELVADVARLTLSGLVRQVSCQLPEDLRVRRRPTGWDPPLLSEQFAKASARTELVLAEVTHASLTRLGGATVALGSCQDPELVRQVWPQGRRLVVTSPPYATALPYVDTDRLSIVLLGLAPASELRPLEQGLTGSREWNRSTALGWEQAWEANSAALPAEVLDLLARIADQNAVTGAGFRRKAVPALLYRYFASMAVTFTTLGRCMAAGERAVFVVGSNRTGPKDRLIEINTPRLLGQVAQTRGFALDEVIPLETWPRFGLHAKNAVDAEDAVMLTAWGATA